jgi:hypothetical protein
MRYADTEAAFRRIKRVLRKRVGIKEKQRQIHDQKTKAAFAAADPKIKAELIKPQLELYTSAVSRKSDVLPVISTLVATLIIVTTLNHELVPLRANEVKTILTLFLVLIPGTLHYYIKLMERTAKASVEIIDSYQGSSTFEKLSPITFLQSLSSDIPIIIVYLLYGIVGLVVFRIWFG